MLPLFNLIAWLYTSALEADSDTVVHESVKDSFCHYSSAAVVYGKNANLILKSTIMHLYHLSKLTIFVYVCQYLNFQRMSRQMQIVISYISL